jgi:hypothetical protein
VAIATNLMFVVAVAAVVIGVTGQASRDAIGATPGPLSSGYYLFTEGLTVIAPLAMLCYGLVSLAGIRATLRSVDGQRRALRMTVAVGALAASVVALFGSLYYSFTEVVPGAGIPGPYRVVPALVTAAVVAAASTALVLRHRRRDVWHAMGAVFE